MKIKKIALLSFLLFVLLVGCKLGPDKNKAGSESNEPAKKK
jgi:hypothetical protein